MNSNDLGAFATAVLTTVAGIGRAGNERFGARKVFISAVFRALARSGAVGSLDTFKARLIEAHRSGLLSLARADLVGAMPADAVAASEISHLTSTFHFVLDPAAPEPWETASVSAA